VNVYNVYYLFFVSTVLERWLWIPKDILAAATLRCPYRFLIKRRNKDLLLERKGATIIKIKIWV
jgi:hypothetical protein